MKHGGIEMDLARIGRHRLSRSVVPGSLVLVVALAMLAAGCGSRAVALDYDNSPGKVVVEASHGGGLPAPWDDEAPAFRLYGDGRVIERGDQFESDLMVEGSLEEQQVKDLLTKIKDTGFFDLKNEYFNRRIMDGVTSSIIVNLKGEQKTVRVYMMDVKPYDAAWKVIQQYPIPEAKEYVPDKGYLSVSDSSGSQQAAVNIAELSGLLPDMKTLNGARNEHKAVEISGAAMVNLKKLARDADSNGLRVVGDGADLLVYPVYQPRQ